MSLATELLAPLLASVTSPKGRTSPFIDVARALGERVGPGASAKGVANSLRKHPRPGSPVARRPRPFVPARFTESKEPRVNDVRTLRRVEGWPSGRQWRKLIKDWRAQDVARERAA